MSELDKKIVEAYIPYSTTLREVGRIVGTDHHSVKRALERNGVKVVRGKRGALTDEHKLNISKASVGRVWKKGHSMPKASLYKNMSTHIRFDVSSEWLARFDDVEKLKLLNRCISQKTGRFTESTSWYKQYIERFYSCLQFNAIYALWANNGKSKYLRPSVDHITPRSKGGDNSIENLQFLTWFENRCKNAMSQSEWDIMKKNIGDYFV